MPSLNDFINSNIKNLAGKSPDEIEDMHKNQVENDPYQWNSREQVDPYEWPDTEPQDKDEDGIGSPTISYIQDLISQTKQSISPISQYFKELAAARQGDLENTNRIMGEIEAAGNDPEKWAKDTLEAGASPIITAAVNKARQGTAFLNNFMAQTRKELGSAKIPHTPKADIGKAPGLRKRVNTKGF
jgi:hypothetical protein